MADQQQQLSDWVTCEAKNEFVQTPTARLFFSVRGPPRQEGKPVIICESGSSIRGCCWAAVARMLEPHVRVYYYDRAGIGRSGKSSLPRTASNMAQELKVLLQAAGVKPPYITVGHTYAGLITREFLARSTPGEIVGMVLVDANQEKTHPTIKIPSSSLDVLMRDLDFMEVTGFKRDSKLTPEEYAETMNHEDSEAGPSTLGERDYLLSSSAELAEKRQLENQALGHYPVVVVRGSAYRDWRLMVDAANARGVGTEEQRREAEAFLERVRQFDEPLQKEALRLSSKGRFVQALNSGHNPQITEPEVVADEVLRILKEVV